MALCDHCLIYDKLYDEMCMKYDDTLPENTHHSRAYNEQIPDNIYYRNADCKYYMPEETEHVNH